MRTHDTTQVRTGIDVYGADGEKIGTVADASNNYFVIEKGYLFTTDLFVPTSAVAAVLDDRVELNLTKEQIERGNYTSPIGDGDSDAYLETMSASGTAKAVFGEPIQSETLWDGTDRGMKLREANDALDDLLGGEDGISPIRFGSAVRSVMIRGCRLSRHGAHCRPRRERAE